MDKTTHEIRLQQWYEIIQEQLASGKSKREWCQENEVPEKQFFYWQRRVRKELYDSQEHALEPVKANNIGARFIEVPIAKNAGAAVSDNFHPDAVICIGSITVGISGNIKEELLMSIGKMIHHAL